MAIADVVLCVYKGREKEGDSRCLEWESNCHDTIYCEFNSLFQDACCSWDDNFVPFTNISISDCMSYLFRNQGNGILRSHTLLTHISETSDLEFVSSELSLYTLSNTTPSM